VYQLALKQSDRCFAAVSRTYDFNVCLSAQDVLQAYANYRMIVDDESSYATGR
jgi:hypothetical protein